MIVSFSRSSCRPIPAMPSRLAPRPSSSSSIRTTPSHASISRNRAESSVLFPAPVLPTTPIFSPGRMEKSTECSTASFSMYPTE